MKTMSAVIAVCVLFEAGLAQDPAGNEATYRPRHRSAQELAGLVRQISPVEIKITGDKLTLRGDDDALIQADKILHRLDRAPRKVTVEFLVAHIAPKSAQDAEFAALTGSLEQVAAKLEAFRKDGRLLELKRHVMEAADGQKTTLKDERTEQIATGLLVLARPPRMGYQARTVGTRFTADLRGARADAVALELTIRDSRTWPDPGGPPLGDDPNGQPIRAPAILNEMVHAAFDLGPDGVQVLRGMARPDRPRLLIVVGMGKPK
jgi:hypothetical protein